MSIVQCRSEFYITDGAAKWEPAGVTERNGHSIDRAKRLRNLVKDSVRHTLTQMIAMLSNVGQTRGARMGPESSPAR